MKGTLLYVVLQVHPATNLPWKETKLSAMAFAGILLLMRKGNQWLIVVDKRYHPSNLALIVSECQDLFTGSLSLPWWQGICKTLLLKESANRVTDYVQLQLLSNKPQRGHHDEHYANQTSQCTQRL